MAGLAEGLKGVLRTVAFVALAAAAMVAVFIVWWLALLLGAAFFAFWYLRRMIRGKPAAAPGDQGVIEGDYRVEPEVDRHPAVTMADRNADELPVSRPPDAR